MLRAFLGLIFMLFLVAGTFACQSATTPAPESQNGATANSSQSTTQTPAPATTPTPGPGPTGTNPPKKVWTNDDLGGGRSSNGGSKSNQKYQMTPSKPADPATVARLKANLEKLQGELDEVNRKLQAYKQFQEGEPVSIGGQEVKAGYIRTPVNQQMSGLQDKKKKLEGQLDDLWEEARKKGVEPGQLR
jgi:hypothetical protein